MTAKMKTPKRRQRRATDKSAHERIDRLTDHVNREVGVAQAVPLHARIQAQSTIHALPMEYLYWELYDRVKLVVPEPTYDEHMHSMQVSPPRKVQFFVEPLGMNGKNLAHTNATMPGQLPNPNTMRVETISLELLEDGQPVSVSCRLWWESSFEFVLGCKPYLTTLAQVMRNGAIPLLPLQIEKQQNFYASFETHWAYNPRRNFEATCRLTGILARCTI